MSQNLATSVARPERRFTSISAWGSFIREVRHSPLGLFSAMAVLLLAVAAVFAPMVSPYDPMVLDLANNFKGPSAAHLFGTDEFGRDIFSRVVWGGRISLATAVVSVGLAVLVGVPLGMVAGYSGRRTDSLIMRFLDVLLSIPGILLAMAIVAVVGASSVNAMFAIAVVSVPAFARLARASMLSQKNKEYVEAARVLGATDLYIIGRSILPNSLGPIIVQMTVSAAAAILTESSLSFLGLGTRPPDPSWGQMLSSGRSYMARAWWYGLFPGIFLTLLVVAVNNLSENLQAAIDPRSRSLRAAKGVKQQ